MSIDRKQLDLDNLNTYHKFLILDLINQEIDLNTYYILTTKIANRICEILKNT